MEAFNTQLLRFFDWLLWASLQGTVPLSGKGACYHGKH